MLQLLLIRVELNLTKRITTMLEFIVLGLVPGTTVQITFAQVLITSVTLLLISELCILVKRHGLPKLETKLIKDMDMTT